jgi:regulator of sigma E protease
LVEALVDLLSFCWNIILVAIGVGFVIFVHELGHFLVAKLCGVKCEKFFLGFDIGGWSLVKFRRGETVYGIGIVPLGGYVKMLGQEDNPAKLRAEIERAKMQPSEGAEGGTPAIEDSTGVPHPNPLPKEEGETPELAAAEAALFDPRSYLAKSVPKRMAIIAAGVTMNVIFAFFAAMWAYGLGVDKPICSVGEVVPGEAAWQAGLRPGDAILEIAGRKVKFFDDLRYGVTVGDIKDGVPLVIRRPGEKKLIHVVLHPDQTGLAPSVGITSPYTTTLVDEDEPYYPGSAASKAEPPLTKSEQIVMIDGEKIENYADLNRMLAEHPEKPLRVTLQSEAGDEKDLPERKPLHESLVPPQPLHLLGLTMEMGAIEAVQAGSPAKQEDIRPKDRILKIAGQPQDPPPQDPMLLPEWFRQHEVQSVVLTLAREGNAKPVEVTVKPRRVAWYEKIPGIKKKLMVSVPQLGIAYTVRNRIEVLQPGGSGEKAGIKPGARVLKAKIIPPGKEQLHGENIEETKNLYKITYDFSKEEMSWPTFFSVLQIVHPRSTVKLTLDDEKEVVLPIEESDRWFFPDREWVLSSDTVLCKATSVVEAARLGAEDTADQLLLVVKILRRVGTGQISPKAFGGPGSIFAMAYQTVQHGWATFLLFLTLLSANLAVINLLPIPVLDGGHLVFLAYEGIRGKPANERIQLVLSMIGLFLLLALMIFVITLDVWRFL